MGWSQRSTGHRYDSLNGFCTLVGYVTDKVLDFCTKNRKCRTCDINTKNGVQTEHDCRLNHYGTAKSMEAEGAVQLIANSSILKNAGAEIGVYIGDNDSSVESALHENLDYTIVKQCDINHSKKGDLRNLPNHVFDNHDDCGGFCKYREDKENYDNTNSACKFVLAASSNTNESINNTMASYCPKANSYSTSESADYRFACAVAHKNLGADYVLKTGGFSPQKDILQIAMKSETKLLSVYLTPVKNIDPKSTAVTGLSKNGRQLFLHGKPLSTFPHKQAALRVLEFLQSF
ncbi:uncharacterized protein LOC106646287, partial [Copidosoma floridanum]|uniref:uncharacterized protein LOC106646287 n=1 Tax=Copidosoma floridanum TaxID=29053 RepID=UPI0006C98773